MDSELIAVARTLAERGWLPGMRLDHAGCVSFCLFEPSVRPVTEADLHLAAIKRVREINGTVLFGSLFVKLMVHDPKGIRMAKTYDEDIKQGDTIALLRCILAASEASESKETT